MISLCSSRQYVKSCKQYFFPYINLYKQTRVNNTVNKSSINEEYLSAVVINCLIEEVELLIDKKLLNTSANKIKLQLTEAQAIVFYKALLALPIPHDQYYLQMIRNEWIQLLDQQIIEKGLYKNKPNPAGFNEEFTVYEGD